jgi:Bacterial TSP3 repeat
MKRLIIVVLSLSANLVALSAAVPAQAQGGPVVVDDASGADRTCTGSGTAGDRMVVCTDLRPGRGEALTDPGAEAELAPVSTDEPLAPAPESDAESAPETTDAAVATATDQDADNAPDELEPGLGLDPTTPDTDGDGVADGDEPNLYGTDPLNPDTDGDGASDGEELFGIYTDPLVWEDLSASGDGSNAEAP